MGYKFLPSAETWESDLAKVKAKPDPDLSKVLQASFKINHGEHPEQRLALLPRVLKLAGDFKKSKGITAAGAPAVKLVQDLIDVVPAARRDLEQIQKDLARTRACAVDVQIVVQNWRRKPIDFGEAHVTFSSPGMTKVTRIAKLGGNAVEFKGVVLRPVGNLTLTVFGGAAGNIVGTIDYEFKPGAGIMSFVTRQDHQVRKGSAQTLTEFGSKYDVKIGTELNIEVAKVNGEVARGSEYKKGYQEAVDWEVEVGLDSFAEFVQKK